VKVCACAAIPGIMLIITANVFQPDFLIRSRRRFSVLFCGISLPSVYLSIVAVSGKLSTLTWPKVDRPGATATPPANSDAR
jgi:hypothetical protein